LLALDAVTTGVGSTTGTPISDSTDTADKSFYFNGGTINITGLDPYSKAGVSRIVNNGLIQAHSGKVTLNAKDRVYLANGSAIDVSGLWIDEPASANTTAIQLNSVELRDYPDQKNGILQAKYITVNNLLGSSMGDISGSLEAQEKTALERSVQGGSITITTPYTGDFISKQGAALDFSGGGVRYGAGYVTSTGLISGNKVYDVSNAPETLQYTAVTGISNYLGSYVEGANAGFLTLQAGKVVLDGNIQGGATAGVYQTRTSELLDKMGNQKTLGLQIPAGGSMFIGVPPEPALFESQDFVTGPVVVQSQVAPLPSSFGPESQLNDPVSYLSAQKLSSAGLSNLQIASNTTLTVTPDADISMNPGSKLSLAARRIDFQGAINVPSGNVSLIVADNLTALPSLHESSFTDNPRYMQVDSEIILAEGS
jgi:hypothetical protein